MADVVEVGLGVDGEVGSFGEPEPELAVAVLVLASLPGRVGVREVEVDAPGHGDQSPFG